MGKEKYKYLFGPVPSRRFGRSLGVDLTPFKTCSLNCVFCQLGRTPKQTIERKEYVPVGDVIDEIGKWMEKDGSADYITLSGSGEPTLHSGFGEILKYLKKVPIPSVLLTNATMLYLPEVRDAAANADIVKMSLCGWNQHSFEWVNRPHGKLDFERMIEGQKKFRAQFDGKLWMEVFLVSGINSMPADVKKIAAIASEIGPDRIQLNTVVRPPAEDIAVAVSKERMEELSGLFNPKAEIIAEFKPGFTKINRANEKSILSTLLRRPCTTEELVEVFGMHINEVSKYLGKLMQNEQIKSVRKGNKIYYVSSK
ncbi:MAG: radical SAM protein [Desulfobacterales bacterium]|nr:radical SAM protein [Desulfobacterales bacterium]